MKMKNERDFILSDTILCAALKMEADAIGVTLEEYVDKFRAAFYDDPQKIYSILEKSN
ncbi:MAG: hypothetical protein IJ012_00720 [Clostridia bacterium]|nr:hypothetical protein [Clostridia bacterium]